MANLLGRIAVIDDDLGIRRSLERLLTLNGFEVELYQSPEHFLSQSHIGVFSCLILDIHFDGMSGLELHKLMLRTKANIPIIFMSAEDASQISGLPPEQLFLHKPFPGATLLEAIGAALM